MAFEARRELNNNIRRNASNNANGPAELQGGRSNMTSDYKPRSRVDNQTFGRDASPGLEPPRFFKTPLKEDLRKIANNEPSVLKDTRVLQTKF